MTDKASVLLALERELEFIQRRNAQCELSLLAIRGMVEWLKRERAKKDDAK